MPYDIIRTADKVKLSAEDVKRLVIAHVQTETQRVVVDVEFHHGRNSELGAATITLAFKD